MNLYPCAALFSILTALNPGPNARTTEVNFPGRSHTSTFDTSGAERLLAAQIPHVHYEGDLVFRGGRPATEDALDALAKAGIQIVINLQGGGTRSALLQSVVELREPGESPTNIATEKNFVLSHGMQFYNFPLTATETVSSDEEQLIGQALQVLATAARNHQAVYIHCEHGVDRTGLIVALFTHFYYSIPSSIAYDEMLHYGHGNFPSSLVTAAMDEYFWSAISRNTFANLRN